VVSCARGLRSRRGARRARAGGAGCACHRC
jgi:hypothetical protein